MRLPWVREAADEFKQVASTETEQRELQVIYTLCHKYGVKSRLYRPFFDEVKMTVEGRIDPDRLITLRNLP